MEQPATTHDHDWVAGRVLAHKKPQFSAAFLFSDLLSSRRLHDL